MIKRFKERQADKNVNDGRGYIYGEYFVCLRLIKVKIHVNTKASPYFLGDALNFFEVIIMIFEEKKIILKNGITAILKTPPPDQPTDITGT